MVELRWDGKYTKEGKKVAPVRIALPFQTIETVNESAQERQKMLDFFSDGKDPEWRNRLIWGDKKYVLPSLLEEFAGKVNLIYIDPPFATGADFSFTAQVPDDPDIEGEQGATFVKEPSILEQKAYRDTWGRGLDSFLQWFYETAVMLRELLAEDGSLYLHIGPNVSQYTKVILDEVFGLDGYITEIIWKRTTAHFTAKRFAFVHDVIYQYAKGDEFIHYKPLVSHDESYTATKYKYEDGKGMYRLSDASGAGQGPSRNFFGKVISPPKGRHWPSQEYIDAHSDEYVLGEDGMPQKKSYLASATVGSVWDDIKPVNSMAIERVNYATQKPEALLERIIKASSNEGDLVLDCFCGSGTTAAVAEKLGRRWITCDLGRFAIHTARKRLLGIPNVRPFTLQNLGKYERQAWQTAEFASPEDARLREARYRKFILDLYRAESISSGAWLHGVKLGRMVHVGAVDAPVTLEDVKAIARETWKRVGSGEDAPESAGVDILGWDFAFELNELGMQVAREAGVDVKFKKIPREVLEKKAVDQGDIKFFELAALTVEAKTDKKKVTLDFKDFIISPDDVPQEVMQAVTHWSQWVDYWAVDWDFKGDTFHNQWQSYRTKKQPKLELKASHTYEVPGEYTVLVKVIDLLGNDTTKALMIKIG